MFTKPHCIVPGCGRPASYVTKSKNGNYVYRNYCSMHHKQRTKLKSDVKKDYCENIDGHLGYKCTAVIADSCQLHIDHLDGDRYNNDINNLTTYCANCHAYKTKQSGDYLNDYSVVDDTYFEKNFKQLP